MTSALALSLGSSQVYQELLLKDPLDPASWTALRRQQNSEHSLADPQEATLFFEDLASAYSAQPSLIYVSISQDIAGRHNFIGLGAAAEALTAQSRDKLAVLPESEIMVVRSMSEVVLLYAQARIMLAKMCAAQDLSQRDELCPRVSVWASNYSVIPDLSIGVTQRLILCNENTLCRTLPEERIFEYLTLIVNCHETSTTEGKYKVGACSSDRKPKVLCQAVHQWYSLDQEDMNRRNDAIQEAMWEQLQKGVVAVHCLAGIHRAACIVACQFLWRHYALGMRDVPNSKDEIYLRLKSVRPAVDEAYGHVLSNYRAHLEKRYGS
mmetsp:Transcript_85067/g.214396  ORF Transcript_85067/g.214396 Transcript_85067/m.214396 type:complete len:323 (+) Transcript_85067:68-1036(+)